MNNIVDIFNSNTREFVKSINQRWMIENKNLTNFETRKFSIPLNIDNEANLVSAIKSEIERDVSQLFIKNLFTTKKFDYLDVRPNDLMTGRTNIENLVKIILISDYDNLISSSYITSELTTSYYFSPYITTANLKVTGLPHCSGKLSGRFEVYNDPYMKYNDGRICLFNNVEFNIGEMSAYEDTQPGSVSPRVIIEYKIAYKTNDSKLIFVIEDENSEAYIQYKSLQRDIKIDNILDGEDY